MTFPSYRDLIYLTWKQYLVRFDLILWANLAIALPVHVLTTLASPAQLGVTDTTDTLVWAQSVLADDRLWSLVALNIGGSLVLLLVDLMLIGMLRAMYHQRAASWRMLWHQAVHHYPRALLASVVLSVVTLVGYSLFIIPGIVVSTLLSLVFPVLVWENVSVGQAFRRSAQLVRKQWWPVFWVLLLTQLWLTVTAWLFLSILPTEWPFTVFALTVISIMGSFQTILTVIVYTACASPLQPEPKTTADKKATPTQEPPSQSE